MTFSKFLLISSVILTASLPVTAEEKINKDDNTLHIYSSRHYDTDQALYDNFTKQTGIQIERVDGKGDALIARLEQEGQNSPADLFITVDSGRLWRAEQAGLFAPIKSDILNDRIPETVRHEGDQWFGFSKRARVFVYNKNKIKADDIQNYSDLTNPDLKGRVCIRTSSNIYNLSLMASMISLNGKDTAQEWATGVLDNLARKPQGGDTDQIKAVAADICDIALVNSYYFYRLMKSDKQDDKDIVANLGVVYPDQNGDGTHINISGAGVLKNADNKIAAIKFLEYLTSTDAQKYFAEGNNEYPVVKDVKLDSGFYQDDFKQQSVNVSEFGKYQKDAMMIFDMIKFP